MQAVLETICDHVYFQPPADLTMKYPAIVYQRTDASTQHADNRPFRITRHYEVTLISRDPDQDAWDKLAQMPTASHDRFFVADNLNHDVFTLYF